MHLEDEATVLNIKILSKQYLLRSLVFAKN